MKLGIELIERIKKFNNKEALIDSNGSYTYKDLLKASQTIASLLLNKKNDLNESRIAYMIQPSFEYVSSKLGIWLSGGIAVPLCISHTEPEIEYILNNIEAESIITSPDFAEKIKRVSKKSKLILTSEIYADPREETPRIDESRRAMILYTSGTTSNPKGVVSTHYNIKNQIKSLVTSWGWVNNDFILNVLPLHHLHGILNILLCSLWSGAKCEMIPEFDSDLVWNKFIQSNYSIFMAVPTIYSLLIEKWNDADVIKKQEMSNACRKMRLMVSGSAALPVKTLEKWEKISGHRLLERYGMTEIGMALSNPLIGEKIPGHIGKSLPGVNVKLFDENNREIIDGSPGEIGVKGANVFLEYWRNEDATQNSFYNGWFKTGDIAIKNNKGIYKILGRNSVDIIKSGGYKISALEIEEVLRSHSKISECAVVGIEDDTWGEVISAALVLKEGEDLSLDQLKKWGSNYIAKYKIPRKMILIDQLPRNNMGKVNKQKIKELFTR